MRGRDQSSGDEYSLIISLDKNVFCSSPASTLAQEPSGWKEDGVGARGERESLQLGDLQNRDSHRKSPCVRRPQGPAPHLTHGSYPLDAYRRNNRTCRNTIMEFD